MKKLRLVRCNKRFKCKDKHCEHQEVHEYETDELSSCASDICQTYPGVGPCRCTTGNKLRDMVEEL
jgi:hypothetical protein